jgi:hypothetical protein
MTKKQQGADMTTRPRSFHTIAFSTLSACEGMLTDIEKDVVAQVMDHHYTFGNLAHAIISTESFIDSMREDGRGDILDKMVIQTDWIDIVH